MSRYPRLTEMGVHHPEQICRYSVSSIGYTDALRITYMRPKGSFLPVSRSYMFPRVQKSMPGKSDTEAVMESNPGLREAVAELKSIIDAREHADGIAAAIIEEIDSLEHDIAMRSAYLKELAARLKGG